MSHQEAVWLDCTGVSLVRRMGWVGKVAHIGERRHANKFHTKFRDMFKIIQHSKNTDKMKIVKKLQNQCRIYSFWEPGGKQNAEAPIGNEFRLWKFLVFCSCLL